ncbi:MAG: DUF4440 domain-containing protein [Planctomycetales bacterium]|nr:DUF4440 domain-containing protein [Planctomycetales bacterium]
MSTDSESPTAASSHATISELLALTQELLEAIATANWEKYQELCDATLTAFEPESRGQLIEGLDFHQYYFELGGRRGPHNTTISAPHVRLLGSDVAVVSYTRLVQHVNSGGQPETSRCEETRVWHRKGDQWRNVHFHRSV